MNLTHIVSLERRWRTCLVIPFAATLMVAGAGLASAQTSAPSEQAPPADTNHPAPAAPDAEAPSSGASTAPGNLSQKLDRSNGVIAPKTQMDPEIRKPTPDLGPQSTPVIPPPGAPGGDQTVQPK